VVSLEETTEGDDETPKKILGADDPVLSGSVDRLRLQNAVDRLPPGYRTIFVLHDVEGYEHNEIATLVGCSIGNKQVAVAQGADEVARLPQDEQSRKGRIAVRT